MPNLMLSWQQAALLAAGLGVAGVLLVHAGRAGRAARFRTYAVHAGPFLREAGVVVALYALWQLAGSLATGGLQQALAHARWIWHTERILHLPSELDVQRLLLPHPLLAQAANIYYATMHFGVLIAVLIWMFARHRDRYPAMRNAMAGSTAICLLISFIPVAPPRMLHQLGFVDLAAQYGQSVYTALGLGADQLSAMPSVHVAWAMLVSWAVITSGVSRWRWLILLHPAITVFVVVGTGNHFWADGIVATTVVAVVLGVRALVLHWAGGPVALADRLDWIRRAGRRHEGEVPAGREAVWTRQELPGAGAPRPRTHQDETLPAETLPAGTSRAGRQRSETPQAGR
jgi:PAP2 superfamily